MSASATRARAIALAVALAVAAPAAGEERGLAGDPFEGRMTFVREGCTSCHSVWGHGGHLGPDINRVVAGKTWGDLIGAFWNHTPRMIEEVNSGGHTWPTLKREQMADLLSYLYYLRLFDDPGDPERGRSMYARLQCGACHSLAGQGGTEDRGGPLDEFSAFVAPTRLAQAMWNAGPAMQRAQLRRRKVIPNFAADEMADLQAFIRAEGLRTDRAVELDPLPDPAAGAAVFRDHGCGTCHGGDGGDAPDIGGAALARSVSQITGLLWNHSYAMSEQMRRQGLEFPHFADNQLSDLISYLYFLGYLGEEGDAERGATLFLSKGCQDCHVDGDDEVPDLVTTLAQLDEAGMAAAMWNHAPQMHSLMARQSVTWPKFEAGEMRHLVAYLRSVAPVDEEESP